MARRVLVTGAEGFIGSHLAEALVHKGFSVRASVQYQPDGAIGWLRDLPAEVLSQIEIFPCDVRDSARVRAALTGQQEVFHLAALIAIPFSYLSPESYIDTNVRGTLNVLQAARDLGTERVLITSTSEVYGTAQFVPITENHPLQAQSPYAASKIAADKLAESFFRSYGLPVTTVRPFNTYGPRQSARAIIPGMAMQMLSGKTTLKVGNLSPKRDLVCVYDTVEGFIRLAGCESAVGEEVNIATGTSVVMEDLVREMGKMIFPEKALLLEPDPERLRPATSEVYELCGSAERLQALTGWKPGIPLAEGLTCTLSWLREKGTTYGYASSGFHL